MTTSGDAAEQVVRLSLEGMEVAAKITGSAAKEVAALLYAALKNRDKNKIKGRQRLTSMLKSGKELTIFNVKNSDMKRFVADAKRYGVVYCALRNPRDNPGGECEIMVRAEDAAKINRIVENIKIATVENAEAIRDEVENGKAVAAEQTAPERDRPPKNEDDILLDDMMARPVQKTEASPSNPTPAKMEKSRPSEPTSNPKGRSAEGAAKADRPSVREELPGHPGHSSRKRKSPGVSSAPSPSSTAYAKKSSKRACKKQRPQKKKKKDKGEMSRGQL